MSEQARWRLAADPDLSTIVDIQNRVHTLAGESRAVFASKRKAFPQGSLVLVQAGAILGYGVFHPWRLDVVPALHALPFRTPTRPDCLFLHDVALLPEARGHGAGHVLAEIARAEASALGLLWLALVSVYDTVGVWGRSGFSVRNLPATDTLAGYGETARYMVASVA